MLTALAPVRVLRAALALCAGLALASPACAQQEDAQGWLQFNTNLPTGPNQRLTLEQIARVSDRQDGLYQTEIGALYSMRVAPGVEFGVGYRHVAFHADNRSRDEDRVRQQVVLTRGALLVRLRLDERFHPDGDEIGFRLRPLLRLSHPLGHGVALFVSHESFILPNSTRWGQRRGYERMRNLVGVTVPLSAALSADVGYLNQYRLARGGARAQMDHAVSVQLTLNLRPVFASHHADD